MSNNEDRLREAFTAHENLAPDPTAVYGRVQELAKTYKRRRRTVQAAGTAVLGAGLVAGVINLPTLIGAATGGSNSPGVFAGALPTPAASTPPTDAEIQARYDAYFQAGYDYDDAVELARLWNLSADNIGSVKAEAGRRLLAGEGLPIQPTPNPPETQEPVDPQVEARYAAYFNAGYDWDDAEKLAKLWKLDDPSEAKVEGGKRLLAGEDLPFKPDPKNVAAAKENQRYEAFFKAGYDYDDAVELAELWKLDSAGAAKIEGGKRLLAGDELPIKP